MFPFTNSSRFGKSPTLSFEKSSAKSTRSPGTKSKFTNAASSLASPALAAVAFEAVALAAFVHEGAAGALAGAPPFGAESSITTFFPADFACPDRRCRSLRT